MANIVKYSVVADYAQAVRQTKLLNNYQLRSLNTLQALQSQMQHHNMMQKKMVDRLKSTTAHTHKMTTASSKMGSQLKGIALQFVGLQAAVRYTEHGIRELVQWVGESINKFRKFEKSMAEVGTILTGVSQDQLPAMQAGIESLSVSYGKAADDLAKATYQILSAAFDVSEAMGLLNVSTKASIAGISTVAESVDIFTSVLNAYGMSAVRAREVSDVLFQSVIRGKFVFKDLASSLGYIMPIAASAGVAFDEVMAAMSTATRQGLRLDMTSRGLALAIQGIVGPTEAVRKAAAKYGIEVGALALETKGLYGWFQELHDATKEFGTHIVQELVPNMRSTRVAAVLAGEGMAGFGEDLGMVEKAAGKTEEALSEMMNITQMQADILTQSMELLERQIGKTWQQVDIWWKTTKLWWATFFTGGDADQAVRNFNSQLIALMQNAINVANIEEDMIDTTRLFDKVFEATGDNIEDTWRDIIDEAVNFDEVLSNIKKEKYIQDFAKEIQDAELNVTKLNKLILELKNIGWGTFLQEFVPIGPSDKDIKRINDFLELIGKPVFADFNITGYTNATEVMRYLSEIVGDLNSEIANNRVELAELQGEVSDTSGAYTEFFGMIATVEDEMRATEKAINNVTAAMDELNEEIGVAYRGYDSLLHYQIDVAKSEMEVGKATEYATIAMKYGGKYLDEGKQHFDTIDTSLHGYIKTIYDYEQAQKDANKVIELNSILTRQNNLEIMRIQLKGMTRRRGLTRSEQRRIRQVQIENMKIRIDGETAVVKAESELLNEEGKLKEQSYKNAKYNADRILAVARWELKELKDTRFEDYNDLVQSLADKQEQMEGYKVTLSGHFDTLVTLQNIYLTSTGMMNQEMRDEYYDTYGVSIPESIQATIDKMNEYSRLYPKYAELAKDIIPKKVTPIVTPTVPTVTDPGFKITPSPITPTEPMPWVKPIEAPSPLKHRITKVDSIFWPPSDWGKAWYTSSSGKRHKLLAGMKVGQEVAWPRGTHYVPETGQYTLHRGETVSPAGRDKSVGDITINVPVSIGKISSEIDVKELQRKLAYAVKNEFTDRAGNTIYGLR